MGESVIPTHPSHPFPHATPTSFLRQGWLAEGDAVPGGLLDRRVLRPMDWPAHVGPRLPARPAASANWGQIIGYYWIYPILLAIIDYYWLLMAFIGYYWLLYFSQKFSYYWLLLRQAPSLIIAIIGTLLLQLLVPLTIICIIGYYCLLLILI
jgi:hypothetical protein